MNAKEMEKIEKYQDLAREVQKLWNMRTKVIPIIIGCTWDNPEETFQKIR